MESLRLNINKCFHFKQKIPPMDEILAGINSSITDLELVSDDTRKAINDTYTSGVQEIEFYKFSMEVKLIISFRRQFGITPEVLLFLSGFQSYQQTSHHFPALPPRLQISHFCSGPQPTACILAIFYRPLYRWRGSCWILTGSRMLAVFASVVCSSYAVMVYAASLESSR